MAEETKKEENKSTSDLTSPGTAAVENAADRRGAQSEQKREKNPHFCARVSLRRVVTPSPRIHANSWRKSRLWATFHPHSSVSSNRQPSTTHMIVKNSWQLPLWSLRPVIVKSHRDAEGIPLRKIEHTQSGFALIFKYPDIIHTWGTIPIACSFSHV